MRIFLIDMSWLFVRNIIHRGIDAFLPLEMLRKFWHFPHQMLEITGLAVLPFHFFFFFFFLVLYFFLLTWMAFFCFPCSLWTRLCMLFQLCQSFTCSTRMRHMLWLPKSTTLDLKTQTHPINFPGCIDVPTSPTKPFLAEVNVHLQFAQIGRHHIWSLCNQHWCTIFNQTDYCL